MLRVTQVLEPWTDFSMIRPEVLEAACVRGTAVHGACEAYANGIWAPALPSEYQGYFDSFKKWFDLYVIRVIFTEKALKSDTFQITGHPDLCAIIKGDIFPRIIDYKTPASKYKTWRAQIGAYCTMARDAGYPVIGGMSLRLRADGGPAIADVYNDTTGDWAGFLSALNAYRYFKQ